MQKKRLLHRVEEIILILLILLNILDFFEILPADLDYVKKIISWSALGYLLYHASLTYIFFNNKHKTIDILLIASYFLLIIKNIVAFTAGVAEEFALFHDFQIFILKYAQAIELYSLIIGSIMLLILAMYAASKIAVRNPSLLYTIHAEGKPANKTQWAIRTVLIYIVYLFFFIVVFNLMMEWLAIAVDAPLVMIGMLGYLYIVMRHYKKYTAETLIYKIGEFGEQFYEKFITLFHYKKTIILGITGMLVLHLVTDALSFVIPHVISFHDTLYFSQLGPNHNSLLSIFLTQVTTATILETTSLLLLFLLNIIGLTALLLLPALYWYIAFSKKTIKVKSITLSIIATGIATLIIAPIFKITRLDGISFVGVDIQTQIAKPILGITLTQLALIIPVLFIVICFLSTKIKKITYLGVASTSIIFFTYYIYLFFTSQIFYYVTTIKTIFSISSQGMCFALFQNPGIIQCSAVLQTNVIPALFKAISLALTLHFSLFFLITIFFYLVGFALFADELIKEKVFNKIE